MCSNNICLHGKIRKLSTFWLKKISWLGRFSTILYKGDNFCDFLFSNLQAKPPFVRRKIKTIFAELPSLKLYPLSHLFVDIAHIVFQNCIWR